MRGGEIPDELKLSGSDLCRDKPAPWALGCLWGHHSLAVFVAAALPLPLPVGFCCAVAVDFFTIHTGCNGTLPYPTSRGEKQFCTIHICLMCPPILFWLILQ